MRAILFLLLALSAPAVAQPSEGVLQPLAEAQALIASGEDGEAYRTIGRALRGAPDDVALLTLRLQLQQRGVGMRARPPFARRIARRRAAERLLRLDSTSAVAHDEIGRQRLEDYLFDRDFLSVQHGFSDVGMRHGNVLRRNDRRRLTGASREVRFNRGGRYDIASLRDSYPNVGKPGMEDDRVASRASLEAAVRHGGAQFAWPLARLLIAEGAFEDLLDLARETEDALLEGAALYRLGRTPEASGAFERALAAMPPEAQSDLDDPARIRPERPPKDAAEFWRDQDVRLLTATNERLMEHRTRVTEADRLFGWPTELGRLATRGGIYIRYGVPDDRVTLSQPFYPGDAHVTQGGDTMVSPRFVVWEYASGLRYVFTDPYWSGDYAIYAPSSLAFSASTSADADDYIEQDERLASEMPDASQDAALSTWPLAIQTARFKGQGGRIDLVVASGVDFATDPADSLRTGVYVLRDGTPEAESVQAYAIGAERAMWSHAVQLSIMPGAVVIASEVAGAEASGDAAQSGWLREFRLVRDFGSGVQLSDVLLASSLDVGREPSRGEIRRGDDVIRPTPEAVFTLGDPVGVYAEVYGLSVRGGLSRYTVEASLLPEDGRPGVIRAIGGLFGRGRRRGVAVRLDATSDTDRAAIPILLDASGQGAGMYTLTLRVVDEASGESATASREVELVAR